METSDSNRPSTKVWRNCWNMIRDGLIEWRDTTELLLRVLDVNDDDLRDGVIEQVEQLLNKREALQQMIQPPFTDDETILGKELLVLEKELDAKLKLYLNTIRQDIEVQQKKKGSANAYLDPYSKVYRDGTFYDKKK